MCGLLIIFPYLAVSHVFQGPGSSGPRFFRVRVKGPGPGLEVAHQICTKFNMFKYVENLNFKFSYTDTWTYRTNTSI